MNARLCSLLVAGGVVLAGIQFGSLRGAVPDPDAHGPIATLQGGAFGAGPGAGSMLKLAIPGYQGVPRVQVFGHPDRVVVDLPWVNRGVALSRKELKLLTSPQVIRWRVAQFSQDPPVTRVALEVAPGTQAEVSCDETGVSVLLTRGKGAVHGQLLASAPAEESAAGALGVLAEASEVVPAPLPLPVSEFVASPSTSAVPQPVAKVGLPPESDLVPAPVVLLPAAKPPLAEVIQPVAKPAPVVEAIQPVAKPAPVAEVIQPAVKPAPMLAAPEVQPVPMAAPAPAPVAKALPPLVPLPAIHAPQETLPALAVHALLPSQSGPSQEPFMVPTSPRKEDRHSGRTLGDVGGHYTGTRMTIDVVGTDLTSFLRIIADTAHLNLIVDQDVQGIYTFKFTDTPWDQVLDVILKHAGLGKEVSNGIIRVAKVEKLQKEEEDRKRLDDAKALSGDTQSITRPLSFAKAQEARNIIDKVLTKRGSLIIDERTNTLIITDLPRNLPLIDDLIAQLDVQIQQVQIEARVVEASKNWEKAFGVQWPTSNSGTTSLTTGSGTAATWMSSNGPSWNSINNMNTGGGTSATVGFSPGQTGVTDITGAAGQFWLSFLSNRMSVNVILQALETEGVVKIVSSPKVVTQNNKKAKIISGMKIPYPTVQSGNSGGALTVAFADADLSLEVTPQITNDGTILMDIHVEKNDANFAQQVQGTPTIITKSIETQVLVKDGGTAIMGGVYKNNVSTSSTGVPFLAKLPLIGWLFRNKTDQDSNDELLVFITPRILKN